MNIEQLRADTPAVAQLIHFNNAGAALMPTPVIDTVTRHLQLEARLGGYEAAAQCSAELENVYGAIARLINAQPDEIAVIENATRAWDMAFYFVAAASGRCGADLDHRICRQLHSLPATEAAARH